MKKKLHFIVTGGAGFIGSHLASRLIDDGYNVTVIDNLSTGRERNIPKKAVFLNLDLAQEHTCTLLEPIQCDGVFHLSGQSSGEASFQDPLSDLRSHVLSTFWLLKWCKEKNVRRFIYTSSMSIYGDPCYLPVDESHPAQPKSFYAAAKASAEAYINLYRTMGIDATIFRLFSVYGPGQNLENKMQGMVSIYLSYIIERMPIIVKGSKYRFRDIVYIDDVVDAFCKAIYNHKTYGKTYNVASGVKTRVEDLIEALKAACDKPVYPVKYADGTPGDQFGIVGDIKAITQDLKWKPRTSLTAGLKKTVDFERERMNFE